MWNVSYFFSLFLFLFIGLNQIGAPVLAKKEELVRILKNNSFDSNKLGKKAEAVFLF